MNHVVADPHWRGWIVWYFFLGGIASGAYFVAALVDLIGNDNDRALSRLGYRIAFPLIGICGILLIVDLDRPERFWHMLFNSEVVGEALETGWPWTGESWRFVARAPQWKPGSPMSVGAWALLLFGLCSSLSLFSSMGRGRLAGRLRRGWSGCCLQVVGSLAGFFVASYTGALLTATNQPVWSDSTWIAPLFLTSAASTGFAVLHLLAYTCGTVEREVVQRLERADRWALGLECLVFALFLASLGIFLGPVLRIWHGRVLVIGFPILGLLLPMAIHRMKSRSGGRQVVATAALVLLGGLVLRYAMLATPPALLERGPGILFVATDDQDQP